MQGGLEGLILQELSHTRIAFDCPDCLCGAPLISMVKSTDLWNLDDPVRLVRLNCPTFWCVLIQRQVRAGFVIIAEIVFEQSAQMVVIEDDHMIQALATNASDHPLHVTILPRTPWRYANFLDAHSFYSRSERFAVDSVAVSNHEPGSARTMKTYRTRKRIVATVKKSIDANCPT